MRLSWKMGRVAGIDLYIHATFLLVLFFVREEVSEGGARALEAILLICSVFGCVLLHELGHALMARRFGIGTEDITLYPIGGVARLQRMPRAPGAELLIALAGPAVNFAIAAGVVALFLLGEFGLGLTWSLGSFLGQLLLVNLCLGLFNLIPAFPMDGGRVLRAILSTAVGRARATQVASAIGQFLAVAFAFAAVVWTHNPIHVLLAAFIYFAARSEEAHVLYEEGRRKPEWGGDSEGMWDAPPGYRWVDRGNGLWQLSPIRVNFPDQGRDASAWR